MIVYRPLAPIQAISFDLDDTLYDNMPYIYAAEAALREHIKMQYPVAASLSPQDWKRIRLQALQENASLFNDIGELRSITLTKGFIQVGMQGDLIPHAVTDCFDLFYRQRSGFVVPQKTQKILKKLAKRVPLTAITNGNVDCEAIGIAPYFSHIIQASPQYPMKPDSAMFNFIANELSIAPKHILHVGDDLEKDVKGAIEAGFQSAWLAVNRPMNLTNETSAQILPHIQLESLKQLKRLL